jgi:hypothetical protein
MKEKLGIWDTLIKELARRGIGIEPPSLRSQGAENSADYTHDHTLGAAVSTGRRRLRLVKPGRRGRQTEAARRCHKPAPIFEFTS